MDKVIPIPLVFLIAVMAFLPGMMSDADSAHMSGEGHGEGIDVVYSSTDGDMGVAVITLRDLPADRVTVSFISLNDGQSVGPLPGERILNVFVRPLLQENYTILVTLHSTSEPIAECVMEVEPGIAVIYIANGGTGTMVPSNADDHGNVILEECTFVPPTGKVFSAWEIDGVSYHPGDKMNITRTVEAKTIWKVAPCTVSFSPGEGSGHMAPIGANVGDSVTLPECTFNAPEGKPFNGWSYEGRLYLAGDSIVVSGNMEFTAQWESGTDNTLLIAALAVALVAIIVAAVLMLRRRV